MGKFIQLVVNNDNLYALDDEGDVWIWVKGDTLESGRWLMVPRRKDD